MTAQLRSIQFVLFSAVGVNLTGCDPSIKDLEPLDTEVEVERACQNPESLLTASGDPSGYERCEDGVINRALIVGTSFESPYPTCTGTEQQRRCDTDSDCNHPDGVGLCITGKEILYDYGGYYDSGIEGVDACSCIYGCSRDSDCIDGNVCVPPGIINTGYDWAVCVPASCLSNDDCESGECSLTSYYDGCIDQPSLACRVDTDECRVDEDCDTHRKHCVSSTFDLGHGCANSWCVPGRPLLVNGDAKIANGIYRSDWREPIAVSLSGLNRKTRRSLVTYWSGIAAMEHASVASFARFALQLMAIGAPPELLLETQAAGADEVQHAQMTFGIASRYAGVDLGPGRLTMEGVRLEGGVVEVLRGLVREACVNETVAVAVAAASAEAAIDPVLQAALRQIVEDETRHSALAWKTLKWMLETHPELADVAAVAFEEGITEMLDGAFDGPVGLDAYGVLSPARQREVYREAVETLVRPCAAQLLSQSCSLEEPALLM